MVPAQTIGAPAHDSLIETVQKGMKTKMGKLQYKVFDSKQILCHGLPRRGNGMGEYSCSLFKFQETFTETAQNCQVMIMMIATPFPISSFLINHDANPDFKPQNCRGSARQHKNVRS